jgi:hypothetical protein
MRKMLAAALVLPLALLSATTAEAKGRTSSRTPFEVTGTANCATSTFNWTATVGSTPTQMVWIKILDGAASITSAVTAGTYTGTLAIDKTVGHQVAIRRVVSAAVEEQVMLTTVPCP